MRAYMRLDGVCIITSTPREKHIYVTFQEAYLYINVCRKHATSRDVHVRMHKIGCWSCQVLLPCEQYMGYLSGYVCAVELR